MILGVKGIQKSLFLTRVLILFTEFISEGFARVLLLPKDLAPNSILPSHLATIFPLKICEAINLFISFFLSILKFFLLNSLFIYFNKFLFSILGPRYIFSNGFFILEIS